MVLINLIGFNILAQKLKNHISYKIQHQIDSIQFWEHSLTDYVRVSEKQKIGTLTLSRTEKVCKKDSSQSFVPQIQFDIYPIALADSIETLESERALKTSCCYPKCGATMIKTKDYIFWSDPWSVKASFNCSSDAIDYTRENANKIMSTVQNEHFETIFELVEALPTKQNKGF